MGDGLQIDHEARRLTLPSGRINGFAYVDLIRMLSKVQESERRTTGRLLGQANLARSDECHDRALVTALEADGWQVTVVQQRR